MSPQDKVERVLKEIHVTFSQCPTYNNEPDKIIVDRKHFLQLLDRLNNGIFDMMEQYEQTRQSRMNAERAFKKKGDEIIEQASSSADDIYAASVLYTADAIGRIRELMDKTNESMNDLFIQFRRELREQKDVLKSHESELQSQLIDLSDTKKYLSVLRDINKERERSGRDWKSKKETEDPTEKAPVQNLSKPADDAAEKPEIIVNKDAAYFKWKEEQEVKEQETAAEQETADVEETAAHGEDADLPVIDIEAALTEDGEDADDTPSGEEEAEHPNPEFPNEESIRQAVLADELAMEEEAAQESGTTAASGKGHLFKTLIFGKDE